MNVELKTPNLIATIILGIIWLAIFIWVVVGIIESFKWDKTMAILEALSLICFSLLIGILLFALLFGIKINPAPISLIIPMAIR